MDDLFSLGPDMVLSFGRRQEELNLVLLIPKTETRAHQEEVTINKVMANRIELGTKVARMFPKISQPWRRSLLGPSLVESLA